jgi:hypothetical protein
LSYLNYLKTKLNAEEPSALIDNAIKYLGDSYPTQDFNLKGYEIVDNWIERIISKWNIEYRILNLSQTNLLGKLEPKQNGFILNLNKNLFSTQRRFTIAHEIAHVLSYNTNPKWPVYEVAHSQIEEYFCDRIARAILLPKNLIDFNKFDLANIDKSQIELIKQLWPEFKVSSWQIIKKIFEDTNSNSLVGIMWEYNPKESCLRIIEHYHPMDIFIPKNDRIFLGNLLQENKTNLSPALAFNSNDIFQGEDLIEIGSLYKKKLFSTTFPIKTKSATYVIQIINTDGVNQSTNKNTLKA